MKKIFIAVFLFFFFTTPAHAQMVISEVYPAPTSEENEWIKIINIGETEIEITDWKLFEHFSSKKLITTFDEHILQPNEFLIYNLESNKLNNVEEMISLENALEEKIDSVHYLDAQSQETLIFYPKPTSSPTPIPNPEAPISPSPSPEVLGKTDKKVVEKNENNNKSKEITIAEDTLEKETVINLKLELHKRITNNLKLPNIKRIEKEGLQKQLPKISYIVQKKVSKEGVIGAIIGGSLLIFTGLLL